jgi:hypothetical protein
MARIFCSAAKAALLLSTASPLLAGAALAGYGQDRHAWPAQSSRWNAVPVRSEQVGYAASDACFRDEYREQYVPGTRDTPGYVKTWSETVAIPCAAPRSEPVIQANRITPGWVPVANVQPSEPADTNSCKEGSLLGGILGAGLGGAISRGKGRWIGVPVGAVAGALVGCQIDGG